jgi:hypothetical protein
MLVHVRERVSPLAIDRILVYLSSGRKRVMKWMKKGQDSKQTSADHVDPEWRVAASTRNIDGGDIYRDGPTHRQLLVNIHCPKRPIASVYQVGAGETLFERIAQRRMLIESFDQSSNQPVCGV